MIEKYFDGVFEQVYDKLGTMDRNIVMAYYNNDFCLKETELVKRYSENMDNVFFACVELGFGEINGAYAPFLDILCQAHRELVGGSFADFMEECDVYYQHRSTLLSYYETGFCKREEPALLHEVAYEQENLMKAIGTMLCRLAEKKPIMIVINHFQLVSGSSLELVRYLHRNPSKNLAMVLACNESRPKESLVDAWDELVELVEDNNQLYHLGISDSEVYVQGIDTHRNYEVTEDMFVNLSNIVELMDYDQAAYYCRLLEKRLRFEELQVSESIRFRFYLLYIRTMIMSLDLAKALELVEEMANIRIEEGTEKVRYYYPFYAGMITMYQGKLEEAESCAKSARNVAIQMEDDKLLFEAELLSAMIQMSGWYNIFFCVNEISIDESLIEKLIKYNYKNHLAHIYIYAYDNRPEVVARAYRSEAALVSFSKGVALAKEMKDSQLVFNAYEKNIMIASTNGMNEIALIFTMRSYQYMVSTNISTDAQVYTSFGYNLATLGINDWADEYYNRAVESFYEMERPEAIAEVQYNMAMNEIMRGDFERAQRELQLVMKAVERLRMNSLRVCNISKIYALLSLTHILLHERFNCERYLKNCSQFLNYAVSRRNARNIVVHDYAMCDDDVFICSFARGLLYMEEGRLEDAYAEFDCADKYMERNAGNLLFAYGIFREKRSELFAKMGKAELCEKERATLHQHKEMTEQIAAGIRADIDEQLNKIEYKGPCRVSTEELEKLVKQAGIAKAYTYNRKQTEFIGSWQKLLEQKNNQEKEEVIDNALRTFLNHFSIDRLMYVMYEEGKANVLYNDTKLILNEENLHRLESTLMKNAQGIVVSKVSESFREHLDIVSIFGEDEVCSLVAIPYFTNGELNSFVIAYVEMRDNWHSSIERYMLNEEDYSIYSLLFREMRSAILRMDANRQVELAAITDSLTGLRNRAGMYKTVEKKMHSTGNNQQLSVMFLDLDNFKPYNDTYGHDAGDVVLYEMSRLFEAAVQDYGVVCRYGGDEFIVLLDTRDKNLLESIAQDIYRRIDEAGGFKNKIEERLQIELKDTDKLRIGCSIGIAIASQTEEDKNLGELIKKADDMLNAIKSAGKGHYAFI